MSRVEPRHKLWWGTGLGPKYTFLREGSHKINFGGYRAGPIKVQMGGTNAHIGSHWGAETSQARDERS